jgi:hypothetical protein
MSPVPSIRAFKGPRGPFLIPDRVLLVAAGGLAIALAGFNLPHELHSTNVDLLYTVVAALVCLVWLGSLALAWRGNRLAVFIAGLIAFVEFGVIAASHFVTAPYDIDVYAGKEGLALAGVLIALLPACALTMMAAIVAWTHPRGRLRSLKTLPVLVVSLLGAVLAVFQVTDSVRRKDFGAQLPEDAAFVAAVGISLWLIGAFWIGRARRRGALALMLGTATIVYPFIALHIVGPSSVSAIAAKSGLLWAGVALAMATLASASFLAALTLLLQSLIPAGRTRAEGRLAKPHAAG